MPIAPWEFPPNTPPYVPNSTRAYHLMPQAPQPQAQWADERTHGEAWLRDMQLPRGIRQGIPIPPNARRTQPAYGLEAVEPADGWHSMFKEYNPSPTSPYETQQQHSLIPPWTEEYKASYIPEYHKPAPPMPDPTAITGDQALINQVIRQFPKLEEHRDWWEGEPTTRPDGTIEEGTRIKGRELQNHVLEMRNNHAEHVERMKQMDRDREAHKQRIFDIEHPRLPFKDRHGRGVTQTILGRLPGQIG